MEQHVPLAPRPLAGESCVGMNNPSNRTSSDRGGAHRPPGRRDADPFALHGAAKCSTVGPSPDRHRPRWSSAGCRRSIRWRRPCARLACSRPRPFHPAGAGQPVGAATRDQLQLLGDDALHRPSAGAPWFFQRQAVTATIWLCIAAASASIYRPRRDLRVAISPMPPPPPSSSGTSGKEARFLECGKLSVRSCRPRLLGRMLGDSGQSSAFLVQSVAIGFSTSANIGKPIPAIYSDESEPA